MDGRTGTGTEKGRLGLIQVFIGCDLGVLNPTHPVGMTCQFAAADTDHTVAPVFCVVPKLQFLLWPSGVCKSKLGFLSGSSFLATLPTNSSSGMRKSRKQGFESTTKTTLSVYGGGGEEGWSMSQSMVKTEDNLSGIVFPYYSCSKNEIQV